MCTPPSWPQLAHCAVRYTAVPTRYGAFVFRNALAGVEAYVYTLIIFTQAAMQLISQFNTPDEAEKGVRGRLQFFAWLVNTYRSLCLHSRRVR